MTTATATFPEPQDIKAFFAAIRLGHTQVALDHLSRHGAQLAGMRDEMGRTALMTVAEYPDEDDRMALAPVLLQHGADPNATDENNQNVLEKAALKSDMICLLLKNGADPAKNHRSKEIYLSILVIWGMTDAIQVLLETHPDVDASALDDDGDTPLIIATKNGNGGMVKYLVENLSVDMDVADNDGLTALMYAEQDACDDIVEYLRRHKAAEAAAKLQAEKVALETEQAAEQAVVDTQLTAVRKLKTTVRFRKAGP